MHRRSRCRLVLAAVVCWAAAAAPLSPAGATSASPHILVVLMENHGAGAIIGNPAAAFENSLAKQYATLTNWTAVDHPSAPNYLALTTGQDDGRAGRSDCSPTFPRLTPCDAVGNNLGVQLAAAGIPSAWYAEDLKGNGCSVANAESGNNDVNHEPWAYLPTWQAAPRACREAGLTTRSPNDSQLIAALRSPRAPDFVWITPNLTDDTHNGSVAQGDHYLRNLVGDVQRTSWYQDAGTIVITYDEDEGESNPRGYCTHPVVLAPVGDHCIATFVVSRRDKGVGRVSAAGDHFGMLRSIEEAYHLPRLHHAGSSRYGDIATYLGH